MDVGASPMEGISRVKAYSSVLTIAVSLAVLSGCASLEPMRKSEFKDIDAAYANVVKVGNFSTPKKAVEKNSKIHGLQLQRRRYPLERRYPPHRYYPHRQNRPRKRNFYVYRFRLFHGLYRHYQNRNHHFPFYHNRKREYHHWRRHKVLNTAVHSQISENHLPKLEDGENFIGRRPKVDPFRPGEDVVLNVSYFNVVAGQLSLKVLPFKKVNGNKAYDFDIELKSNKIFSLFYSVDDHAETFVDYNSLTPITYTLDANESSQQKETRAFFDWNDDEATEWEKVIHPGDDHKSEKTVKWKLDPYSQNFISAIYYLRTFTLRPGKRISFHVAGDGKNYVFDGNVLRREKLVTEAGTFNTLVVQPTFHLKGKFQATGDNYIWLTDDARKLPVQIKLKIKIGSLLGKLARLDKGQ